MDVGISISLLNSIANNISASSPDLVEIIRPTEI